ncbi:hypothetical protein [Curtobacterium sp. B8]|uniref:hypothetical protein n=1 Tax=Curtobacterium sp. B8 TaxID=95611 RepID=UPI000349C5BC|nr:hypothetical protein [Curtobacterium sp. B8]
MDTRAEDTVDEAPPPGWVLDTPTRHREVWTLPACAAALAVLLALLGTQFGETLGLVVCTASAVVVAAGAVALAVAGRTAYAEQTVAATWRLHVVRVVVGVTTTSTIAVGSLAVGFPLGWFFGAAAWVPMSFRLARSVPRTDRVIVAWASVSLAVACLTLSVVGFTVHDLPQRFSVTWIGPGAILGALALAMAVVQFALAERTPPDPFLAEQDGADT